MNYPHLTSNPAPALGGKVPRRPTPRASSGLARNPSALDCDLGAASLFCHARRSEPQSATARRWPLRTASLTGMILAPAAPRRMASTTPSLPDQCVTIAVPRIAAAQIVAVPGDPWLIPPTAITLSRHSLLWVAGRALLIEAGFLGDSSEDGSPIPLFDGLILPDLGVHFKALQYCEHDHHPMPMTVGAALESPPRASRGAICS